MKGWLRALTLATREQSIDVNSRVGIPASQQISATATPSSACFRMKAICASVKQEPSENDLLYANACILPLYAVAFKHYAYANPYIDNLYVVAYIAHRRFP